MIKNEFKKKIEILSNEILEKSGIYRKYNDMDLANATLIFQEVIMAKTYNKHRNKLTQEQMEQMAEELGKSLHQTILLFTSVDLHKVLKK